MQYSEFLERDFHQHYFEIFHILHTPISYILRHLNPHPATSHLPHHHHIRILVILHHLPHQLLHDP